MTLELSRSTPSLCHIPRIAPGVRALMLTTAMALAATGCVSFDSRSAGEVSASNTNPGENARSLSPEIEDNIFGARIQKILFGALILVGTGLALGNTEYAEQTATEKKILAAGGIVPPDDPMGE